MLAIKYFTSTWCGPCKAFAPTFDQVMSETGVNYQKIDVDTNKELTMSYMVSSVPTLVFEVDNTMVFRHSGVMSRVQLLDTIRKYR